MALNRTTNQNKYNRKTYAPLTVRIKKDGSDDITIEDVRQAAELAGESVNTFVLQAIRDRMAQMK